MNKSRHLPYEMQRIDKPARSRFFYARAALALAAIAGASLLLTGCDNSNAASHSASAEAARQDAEALSSREWAGQQVCGMGATPVWEDDKTLVCLRDVFVESGDKARPGPT